MTTDFMGWARMMGTTEDAARQAATERYGVRRLVGALSPGDLSPSDELTRKDFPSRRTRVGLADKSAKPRKR
jgi:hypothetical protein